MAPSFLAERNQAARRWLSTIGTAPGGLLTLVAADDDQAIDLAGSTGSLLTEFGIAAGPANPNTLLLDCGDTIQGTPL